MMDYNFREIEAKWQQYWQENQTYKTEINESKQKFYVLDMFPYPSGAGLHVGHPLGYIASDIFSRYKRLKGFNVLHPMGYDAYGLPAEQYAIQTGQHPAITTSKNIARYREQLDKIGFSFDWNREVQTCDPKYYKWTQWTFIQLFNSYYNKTLNKAQPIIQLIKLFETSGTSQINAHCTEEILFSAAEWKQKTEKEQQEILMNYRLAYLSETIVNWCPKLGTVLANDEVKDGFSERGGYPVERKLMKQWSLRISAYAQRLLDGLSKIDWSESLKEIQKNWIGRSEGASVKFKLADSNEYIEIFTTRPDTIFGATFMVIAPEHELVKKITNDTQKNEVIQYIDAVKNRSERERMTEVKRITGVFTGSYAINPFTEKEIPIWIADYVLSGYGTGAIMAVPAHDSRDYAFAKHFQLPIIQVVSGGDISNESYDAKDGIIMNSGFIDGLTVKEAISKVIRKIEEKKIGQGKVNFRLRDAIFSRQRYWGEPFPIYYKEDMPYPIAENELPLELPEVDAYLPTETGEPPLARAKNWETKNGYRLEYNTMPGFAGSSAYYLRYMDALNNSELVSKKANEYWRNVDLYIGGAEHATGHLIYSRFWNKFLFDLGYICEEEPFKKLINQGMIQGRSSIIYKIKETNKYVSAEMKDNFDTISIHVDVNIVDNDVLDIDAFKKWRPEYENAEFIMESNKFYCHYEVEKMSKSLHNVVNPDDLIEKYGADTLRLYEMFLGPLEQHKPWDTKGVEGVHRFIKKFWRLFFNQNGVLSLNSNQPTENELKILHKTIKKIQEDIERFSFNTAVSTFMICVNELHDLKCNNQKILEDLLVLISPFAPHFSEELWHIIGHNNSITQANMPLLIEEYTKDNIFSYPVSFNGKTRFKLELPLDMEPNDIENIVKSHEESKKWLNDLNPKKIIVVKGKIINVVL